MKRSGRVAGLGGILWAMPWILSTPGSAGLPASTGDVEAGRRIYEQGVLPSGEPLRGTVVGDVVLEGAAVQCAACHRRSGFGTTEGGAYVAPITAPWLFGTTLPDRADLFRKLFQEVQSSRVRSKVRALQVRPPYSASTLAAALRTGRDPSGRQLDSIMPRFRLDDTAMAQLVAYLRTLGQEPDPGVGEEEIHFATVVAGDVDPAHRQAMLEVIEAYFRRKNADTEAELLRPGYSPYHRDEFYRALRRWVLHVWQLEGDPAGWPAQLEACYRRQPVFAILSGLGEGAWQPIHDFSERHRIPSLFPNTEQPVDEAGGYSLYLSPGWRVEGAALARHLQSTQPERIVELRSETAPATLLSGALHDHMPPELRQRTETLGIGGDGAAWAERLRPEAPAAVVLWTDDVEALESELLEVLAQAPAGSVREIFLSFRLLGERVPEIPTALANRVYLTYPYALPSQEVPRIHRVRGWLRSRRLPATHERLRLNTYFALSIADHALVHLVESFSRDYFVEGVEHEAENGLNPGVYPRLSLGPGQRFAAKGCYVVRVSEGQLEPVSEWIVP